MTRFCIALFLVLVPALAVAQDQTPPPKGEIVTIRDVAGTFEVTGTSAASFFEFTQRCESRQGGAESSVSLTLPLDLQAGPNDSLEGVTKLLRDAAARATEVSVESPGERPKVMFFYWSGFPVFRGVIESLNVKYTLFLPDGTPARATVHLNMRQASGALNKKGESKETNKPGEKKKSDCSPSQQ